MSLLSYDLPGHSAKSAVWPIALLTPSRTHFADKVLL